VLRAENAALVREILVEGGVSAPPILAGRELVAVTGVGSLAVMDLGKGIVAAEIPAGLSEPVFAPRYRDGMVCVADKAGHVVAFDVAARALRWERKLDVGVAAEPEMDGLRVYLWTDAKTLVTLSLTDGEDSRIAAAGVESAPLLSNGRLYWGAAGGRLVVAEASSGRVLKRIDVGEAQSLRPLMIGDTLYAGTAGGKIIKIDPNK
jgi:outer membrane protein assembly factor BamB